MENCTELEPVAPEAAIAASQAKIEHLEGYLKALPQREDVQTEHLFAPGVVMRRMVLPAGTIATGAAHKHQHLSIMVSGDITCLTEHGLERLTGYHEWIAPAGVKRVGITHAETVWLTVHASNATNVTAFEEEQFEQAAELLSRQLLVLKSKEKSCPQP